MKRNSLSKVFLTLIILAGAIVAFVLLRSPEQPPPQRLASSLAVSSHPPRAGEAITPTRGSTGPQMRSYSTLSSESDWRLWINTLREAGVPLRVMARLVREGVEDQWRKRHDATYAGYMAGRLDADDLAAAEVEHDLELDHALRAALGEADFRTWDLENVLQSINVRGIQFTDAETESLYDLERSHRQKLNQLLLSKLKGQIDQLTLEERQSVAQADHDARLATLLGQERFATIQGTDEVAEDLQRELDKVADSGDVPFESVVVIQKQWMERRREMEDRIQEARSQIASCELELQRTDDSRERELQRVLGADTFDALERGGDPRYGEMKRYALTWGLDDSHTDFVYQSIKYYEKAVNEYETNVRGLEAKGQPVDWDAVQANVTRFAQQTEISLKHFLGNERFSILKNTRLLPFAATPSTQ